MPDFSDFLEIQTRTPWGHTLADFADFCAPPPGTRLLDLGCGPGLLPAIFAGKGCRAFGVDLDFRLLASHLFPALVAADAFSLPFPARTFDLVTAVNLLFLLDDPSRALREMARILKRSGEICLINPSEHLNLGSATRLAEERRLDGKARQSLLNWAGNAEQHVRWTKQQTKDLLVSAGFELVESSLRVGPGFARYARGKRN